MIFLFILKMVYCVYSLESPRRGDSNENTQNTFISNISSQPITQIKANYLCFRVSQTAFSFSQNILSQTTNQMKSNYLFSWSSASGQTIFSSSQFKSNYKANEVKLLLLLVMVSQVKLLVSRHCQATYSCS